MNKVLITGSSGFVGRNLLNDLGNKFEFTKLERENLISGQFEIMQDCVIHLAGLAHDTRKSLNESEYFTVNTVLTKQLWEKFVASSAKVFIYVSSIKSARDKYDGVLTEEIAEIPLTPYGKSKLLAEKELLKTKLIDGKKIFILRPALIYGKGSKGNLNLLMNYIDKRIPWFFGNFSNQRSMCSIENFNFVVDNLMTRNDIESGIYNVCDSEAVSTNQIIEVIGTALNKPIIFISLPRKFVLILARFGDFLKLPLNSETLEKITGNCLVSNSKLIKALKKPLPFHTIESLFNSINFK